MSKGLSADQILPLLDSAWWSVNYLNPPTTVEPNSDGYPQYVPSTMLYFQDQNGNYHQWQSSGVLDPYATGQLANYLQTLMNGAAYELSNMGCFGGITNIMPKSYQVFPIYFK